MSCPVPQRDRDDVFGWAFRRKVRAMGIEELISAARSLWQNAFVEGVIGSIRRECTDHIIPMGERHLLRVLRDFVHAGRVCVREESGAG